MSQSEGKPVAAIIRVGPCWASLARRLAEKYAVAINARTTSREVLAVGSEFTLPGPPTWCRVWFKHATSGGSPRCSSAIIKSFF